ncbi:MAG TPA: type II toxin-antitoxin system RelE/ParE family toxin [Urbifossiella sp.]|nr:type II toxin-antitoxin system RelE/ParE family toxin [Urbifossiella sp.]
MNLPIVLRRAAQAEFDEAADWYDRRQTGRGGKFTTAVAKALATIAATPEAFSEVFEDVREAPVARYPFAVYYRLGATHITVVAVFHTSRDPSVWQSRL